MSNPNVTAARPTSQDGSHWYFRDGRPCYELPKKTGGGMKAPTLADARKLDLVPSVTTILKILAKPALTNWLIEQAILAVITSPRREGETDDAFVDRIINVEMVQDQERDKAAQRGRDIHEALEFLFRGQQLPKPEIYPWVKPAFEFMRSSGELVGTEKILLGDGFAGRADLFQKHPDYWILRDYKSTKSMPNPKQGAWPEHRLQLAAYAKAFLDSLPETERCRRVVCSNVYISTIIPGSYVVCETEDWFETYERGFKCLLNYWQFANQYAPTTTPEPTLRLAA